MNRIAIAIIAALVWSGAMLGAGWAWRGDRAEAAVATGEAATGKQALQVEQAARATEHKQAEVLADIGAKHEEDRQAAQAVPDAVVADLRSGVLQLRNDLATCSTDLLSRSVTGAIERDAHAQLRSEVAGAAVQIVRDADDQLRACQAVVLADRGQVPQSALSARPGAAPAWNATWNLTDRAKLNGDAEHERSLIRSEMAGDPGASPVLPGGIRTPVRDSISAPRDAPPQVGQK
ncbi:lysis system i-spanin subunit Rz [Xanthomonas arboricola]|uniref:lysis system i-spanin subunit Rz n=1 Tax=Xanthomonas arboricola TaxID=56448 RepID=UPI000F8C35C9|nr:lysis system i-spanin subunit Rz [Xanthomonas arboricola]